MSAKYISEVIFEGGLTPTSYLNALPVIKFLNQAERLAFSSPVTFFVGENGIAKANYKDTEHYRITKQFLNDPDRMLYYLLSN